MKRFSCILLAMLMIFSVCTFGASSANTSDAISRVSCVINGDTENSRGLSWYTDSKMNTNAQVMLKDDYNGSFASAKEYNGSYSNWKGNFVHKVVVDGLAPGKTYVYRVGDKAKNTWSEVGTFITDSGKDNKFDFIAIADVQASNNDNFARASKTMDAAVKTAPNAEFYVNLGDYVNDCTDEEWSYFFSNFTRFNLTMTHVPVAGNHDGNMKWHWFNNAFNLGEAKGSKKLTGVYYSYDYGNAHIAVLNTNDMYPMSQEQRNWLINDMKQSDADWKMVMMHRAAYSAGKNINKPDTLIMRSVLLPIFEELDIDFVYAGHDHIYFRSLPVNNDVLVEDVQYVTEQYKGEETSFAVNPEGTVHVLPNTAGTKKYKTFKAMHPILDCAAIVYQPQKPVFSVTSIDGDKLVYKAYAYDEETAAVELIDTYAIKKTLGQNTVDPNYVPLTTDSKELRGQNVWNFITDFSKVILTYIFKLVPQAIIDK